MADAGRSWTLSDDRRTMVVRHVEPAGVRIVTLSWADPAEDWQVEAALRERPLPTMHVGERRWTRRLLLGPVTLYLHRMTGPPTWWWPRLFVHQRSLVLGWFQQAAAVAVCRRPMSDDASDQTFGSGSDGTSEAGT